MVEPVPAEDAFAFTLTDADGAPYPLERHRGQALLIVNTATRCGFSAQLAGLQALHQRFAPRGFSVIGLPSRSFLWQERLTGAAAREACSLGWGVRFPLMAVTPMRGRERTPLVRWLVGRLGPIRWNFAKFLVGRDGRPLRRFGTWTKPEDPRLVAAIEAALADPRE